MASLKYISCPGDCGSMLTWDPFDEENVIQEGYMSEDGLRYVPAQCSIRYCKMRHVTQPECAWFKLAREESEKAGPPDSNPEPTTVVE